MSAPLSTAAVRVLLAEDQYLTREGTRRLLMDRPEVDVVGVAEDYDDVLAQARALHPDVVVLDIKMPPSYGMEGIDAAHVIKSERPETGVVMLTQQALSARRLLGAPPLAPGRPGRPGR